jgi:excinuclease UvrABC nuclease subunit
LGEHHKEYRIDTRINEHISSGKNFDEVIYDNSKTITEAQQLEKYRIKRFKPKYNIQHNS